MRKMTRQIQLEMDAAVARGVKYLDKQHPGWFSKINLATLDLEAGTVCILGQCFGSFWTALETNLVNSKGERVNRDNPWAIRHGFNAPGSHVGSAVNGAYEYLTYTWAAPIAVRQVKAAREAAKAAQR